MRFLSSFFFRGGFFVSFPDFSDSCEMYVLNGMQFDIKERNAGV